MQFRPNADGQYYAQTLEAFCSFKSMRTFRLVTEESFALPWCLSLSACGHTFAPGGEHFIPKSLLSHRRLTFPACHAGDAAYQTVSLKTDSNTQRPRSLSPPLTPLLPPLIHSGVPQERRGHPMLFSVTQDASGVFTVLPRQGVVPAAPPSSSPFVSPLEGERNSAQFCAILRNSSTPRFAPPRRIVPQGRPTRPEHRRGAGTHRAARSRLQGVLIMEHGGTLHLPTTCIGSASTAAEAHQPVEDGGGV